MLRARIDAGVYACPFTTTSGWSPAAAPAGCCARMDALAAESTTARSAVDRVMSRIVAPPPPRCSRIAAGPMRILVVEDEQKVANALREGLEVARYDVVVEHTGEGAFFRLNTEAF